MRAAIWRVPAYLPYLQPPLTSAAVAQVEDDLGVSLPDAYLTLLREQNGGYVRLCFADADIVHTQIWGIGPYFPNIAPSGWWREIITSGVGGGLLAGKQLLVPFDGDGHWFLCFDYRKNGEKAGPSVTYIDLEGGYEREVAPSFSSFLGMLTLAVDANALGIHGVDGLESVVHDLNAALGVEFDMLSNREHGYPVYRWPLGNATVKNWAWLSPNCVPRGFVRESDARYPELAGLRPGMALRFPEYPDVHFVLACTDGSADRVRAACVQASLMTRPIP
jgi:hypothetical protein